MRVGMRSLNTGRTAGRALPPSRGAGVVEVGRRRSVTIGRQRLMRSRQAGVCWAQKKVKQQKEVSYGRDWYQQTRDAMNTKRSAREEMGMCVFVIPLPRSLLCDIVTIAYCDEF